MSAASVANVCFAAARAPCASAASLAIVAEDGRRRPCHLFAHRREQQRVLLPHHGFAIDFLRRGAKNRTRFRFRNRQRGHSLGDAADRSRREPTRARRRVFTPTITLEDIVNDLASERRREPDRLGRLAR